MKDFSIYYRYFRYFLAIAILFFSAPILFGEPTQENFNLLLNPRFEFHPIEAYRTPGMSSSTSGSVAFWDMDQWGDIDVVRDADEALIGSERPPYGVANIVRIKPGKRFYQFITLTESRLSHGDDISLIVGGYQREASALKASIHLMKVDSQTGEWNPSSFGINDNHVYPKYGRGELVPFKTYSQSSERIGQVVLNINSAEVIGQFKTSLKSNSANVNTIGLTVEFKNVGKKDVFIWNPSLVKGYKATMDLPCLRKMTANYRYLPRTVEKLWKGQPIHILVLGGPAEMGQAKPPLMAYDENPKSATFKQPLSKSQDGHIPFEGKLVGHPELNNYFSWMSQYFSFAGRLKVGLMKKFNVGPDKIFINQMPLSSSTIGEWHTVLDLFCALKIKPNPWLNGHRNVSSWQEIYPQLTSRLEGPGPDLVIIGSYSGKNIDGSESTAVFEGAVRWIQQHYPHTEFLFSPYQDSGTGTNGHAELQAIALKYQIPFVDFGKIENDIKRWCNKYALVPKNQLPQAACHYLWYKAIENVFESWDPIVPGQKQLYLPERVNQNTYGWEGSSIVYKEKSPRLQNKMFVFDDTAINLWAEYASGKGDVYIDGVFAGNAKPVDKIPTTKDPIQPVSFSFGNCSFGNRHIMEIDAQRVTYKMVNSKLCPNRRYISVDNPAWQLGKLKVTTFDSQVGAPYGIKQVIIPAGSSVKIEVVGTDLSIAYVDSPDAGILQTTIDGKSTLTIPTTEPFVSLDKKLHYMENRKAVAGLGYGWHELIITAKHHPVKLLGVFTYDRRPNRRAERSLSGFANKGDEVILTPPFQTRPIVLCHGNLKCNINDVTPGKIKFSDGSGFYQVIGGGSRLATPQLAKKAWQPITDQDKLLDKPRSWKNVYEDFFKRKELGKDYTVVKGAWKIEDNRLRTLSKSEDSILLFKGVELGDNYRITFTCRTLDSFAPEGACDMSFYANIPTVEPPNFDIGYFFAFGTHNNLYSGLMRSCNPLFINKKVTITPQKMHHVIIQRLGNRFTMVVDKEIVFDGRDVFPVDSYPDNKWSAFYVSKSIVDFGDFSVSTLENSRIKQ